MKLTKEQRETAIAEIIENNMEQMYKPRDIFNAFYEGINPYKDMTDEEIIEYYEETGGVLPEA